jgi:putative oxidoreductase
MARRIPPPVVDVVLLLARVAIGVIFVAHGWQKLHTWGIDGTQHAFRGMGVPAPSISALYAIAAELIGGVLLIAGVLMPIAGLLLFLDMAGAILFVHIDKGIFVEKGGYELALSLGAAALTLAVVGTGRYSVDGLLRRRSSAAVR